MFDNGGDVWDGVDRRRGEVLGLEDEMSNSCIVVNVVIISNRTGHCRYSEEKYYMPSYCNTQDN